MRKLTLYLVCGILFLAACVPSTPGPLIPQTGATAQPGTPTAGGSSLTIVPPGSNTTAEATASSQGGANGTQTAPAATTPATQATGASGIPLNDPQATDQVPQTTRTEPSTQTTPSLTDNTYTYTNLLDALRGMSGVTVEERGQVQEPFFNVAGRQVRINGADVTVFEFPDATSHQTALGTVTANGGLIGTMTPSWAARPNFYSKGNLIALYLGSDQPTLDLLRQVFGDPLTYTNLVGGLTPDLAFLIQSTLSKSLNVGLDQIRIVDVSQKDWSDSCLGLGSANESCAQVVTPGYSISVEVGTTRYELRANQTGTIIRFKQQ